MSDTPWPHFTRAELQCKCGCGKMEMDPVFMAVVEAMRVEADFEWPVVSGYRCPMHNNSVSHTGFDGPHTTGKALDIHIYNALDLVLIQCLMVKHGLLKQSNRGGIGLKQSGPRFARFIHIDMLTKKERLERPAFWTYR